MDTSRREFIKAAAAGTVAATAGFGLVSAEQTAASVSEVVVGKGNAAEIIPRIVEKLGGMGNFVKPGSRVLIKPNMSFANPPEWATTTSPEAIAIVAQMCLKAGAKRVIVCDYTLRESEICKQKTGIPAALKDLKGVVVFTPKEESLFEIKTDSRAKTLIRVGVVKELLKADTFISLPIAKSHSAGGVSFNCKGLMGLVWDRGAMHSTMDLHMAIAEQLYYMRPQLCIVDGSRALLDNGPAGPGKVAELKTYVAGTDPVAVDSYAVTLAAWYGRKFEGKQVQYLKNAAALGLGNVESDMIKEIAV